VRHNKARLPLEALAPFCLDVATAGNNVQIRIQNSEVRSQKTDDSENLLATVDWSQVYASDNPVEIEVGSGKGLFLVTSAQTRPNVNFLGIEVVRALQYYIATRLAKRNLTNARAACVDARWFFRYRVAAASVQAVHVYFPDPWWKARHKKRRVFTPDFAESVATALVPGGRLYIATDVKEYFGVMTELVTELPVLRELDRLIQSGPVSVDEVLTNFEHKARIRGGSVWRASYVKTV